MKNDKSMLSSRIILLRNEKQMSQVNLATLVGVSQETISSIECRKIMPKLSTLIKISEVLECSLDYLIGKSDVKLPSVSPELLDSHQYHLVKNYKKCDSRSKEILILISDILSNNNIILELEGGKTVIKNFISNSN